MRTGMVAGALGAALTAGPLAAELATAETPSGTARVEGDRLDGGERLVVGGWEAIAADGFSGLWIEAEVGSLLLVAISEGGTACAAEWVWVHTAPGDRRVTERFGTCADLVAVSHDAETVTVSMPSSDADHPTSDFVYDGRGPVREVARGQEPSGAPPEAGADAWVGRYPYELFRSADWRGPLVALLGEDGYAAAQGAIGAASPMAADGAWVAGEGCAAGACGMAAGAVAISRDDGRLLVAVDGPDGPPELWGDPGGPLPRAVAAVMAGE